MLARGSKRNRLVLSLLMLGLMGLCLYLGASVLAQTAAPRVDIADAGPFLEGITRAPDCANTSAVVIGRVAIRAATPICLLDPYEPNDDFAQAWNIGWGGPIEAYICPTGDVDYYYASIGATPFNGFAIELNDLPANYDLYVYDMAQQLIASSTHSGTASERVMVKADNVYIKVLGVEGAYDPLQSYRLIVHRVTVPVETPTYTTTPMYTPTATRTPTGTPTGTATSTPTRMHTLSVRLFLAAMMREYHPHCSLYEPNNNYLQAWGPLDMGRSYTAYLCTGDPDDWYYMVITTPITMTIDLTVPQGGDYDLYLYREEENRLNLVLQSDRYGNGTPENIPCTLVPAGRYYILVHPYSSGSDVEPYVLTVRYCSGPSLGLLEKVETAPSHIWVSASTEAQLGGGQQRCLWREND